MLQLDATHAYYVNLLSYSLFDLVFFDLDFNHFLSLHEKRVNGLPVAFELNVNLP